MGTPGDESDVAELNALVDAFPDVGFILDSEGRYLRVLSSPDTEHLLYDDPEELLGRRMPEVFDEEMAEMFMTNIERALESGDLQSFEYELDVGTNSRTERRWFEARIVPVTDDGDRVVYVARDITERETCRRSLARPKGYMDAMLDSLDDVFYALDLEGNLVDWNRAVERVTGYDGEALSRCAVYDIFGECAAERLHTFVDEVVERGSARRVTEIETRAGAQIPYEFVANLFEDPDGDDLVVGIGRDVSERVEREEQVRVFGRVLRHNMRNKMTVIEGTAESLAGSDEAVTDGAARITAAAENLMRLTEKAHHATDILLTESERTVVDVDRVVREVVADCRRRFDGADISYEGTVQATATAVPAVSRAVTELVENAVKHSRDDPTAVAEIGTEGAVVDLSVSVRGEDVYVTVSDEGPGLPDHEANILTEEREISPVYHASGMGLWLVRWVIKRSRGEVDIVENGSTGATVEIRLPRTETAPDRPTGDRQNRPG